MILHRVTRRSGWSMQPSGEVGFTRSSTTIRLPYPVLGTGWGEPRHIQAQVLSGSTGIWMDEGKDMGLRWQIASIADRTQCEGRCSRATPPPAASGIAAVSRMVP